ncbi:Protein TPX2 [Bienertia sinuspersici]
MDNSAATRCRFKARPFNKKIYEAPMLPFPRRTTQQLPEFKAPHLEPSERIKQQNSTAASTSVCQTDKGLNKVNPESTMGTGGRDGKMSHSVDAPKVAVRQVVHAFKARPLDRKILTSRGDIGVFRNSKRDVTVPKEFEFQKSKRNQNNLPTELFSKLSLAGEPQLKNCAQVELPKRTSSIPAKMTHQAKEKQDTHRLLVAGLLGAGDINSTYFLILE